MWLPVSHSYTRNATYKAVATGRYNNIRGQFGGSGSTPNTDEYKGSNPWMTALQAVSVPSSTGRGWDGQPKLSAIGASCWYFAQG